MRDLANDRSLLSINSTTVKPWSLEQLVDGCARAGITAISPWRDIVQGCGVERAGKLIRASGMTVTGLCRGGMFTAADEAGRRAALDDNRRAVDEAAAIGAQCLILVAGGLPKGSRDLADARRQVRDALAALLPYARQAGVPLAIEPLHPMFAADRACVNTLAQANDLCEELGEGAGVAVDVYHLWWDPDLEHQIARAGRNILAYHVNDWLVPTTDLLLDRGMMGDGVIDLRAIRAMVEAAGYRGHCEVEILPRRIGGSAIPTRCCASASSATRPWCDPRCRLRVPGHVAADVDEVGFAGARLVDQSAVEDNDDAVGELEQLVEVLAHQQHRCAAVAHLHDLGVDLRHRGEIEPEAGISRDHHIDLATELARQHGALHVAAREIADRRVRAAVLIW